MWFSVEALVLKHGNVEIGGSTRSLLAASVKVDGVEKKNLRERTGLGAFIGEPHQTRLSGPFLLVGPKIFVIQVLGIRRRACKKLLIGTSGRSKNDRAAGCLWFSRCHRRGD
jgi:hypothetical protein